MVVLPGLVSCAAHAETPGEDEQACDWSLASMLEGGGSVQVLTDCTMACGRHQRVRWRLQCSAANSSRHAMQCSAVQCMSRCLPHVGEAPDTPQGAVTAAREQLVCTGGGLPPHSTGSRLRSLERSDAANDAVSPAVKVMRRMTTIKVTRNPLTLTRLGVSMSIVVTARVWRARPACCIIVPQRIPKMQDTPSTQ